MKAWERIVSFLSAIILFVVGLALFLLLFARIEDSYNLLKLLGYWWVLGIAVVILLIAFFSFQMSLRMRREEKTIISPTQYGEIRIALSAVETLALRSAKRIKGVKEAYVRVRADLSGMDIFVEITAQPDVGIPQISEEIRVKVAEYILETVGIKVNSVKVLVGKVASETKSRVE